MTRTDPLANLLNQARDTLEGLAAANPLERLNLVPARDFEALREDVRRLHRQVEALEERIRRLEQSS
jgi:ubiquinone biosynthesis protein UbiJ